MNQALVTGGAGFIGSHIVEALLKRGTAVRVLDNLSTGKAANISAFRNHIDLREGDIRDPQACASAAQGCDVIFHLAAQGSVPRSIDDPVSANEINVAGTINVLITARDAGVRRVVFSASSSAYGETPTLPKHESMTPQPLSPYAVSKLAAEQYCQVFSHVYGLSTASLRYFNVFGPRQDPASQYAAVIPAFLSRLLRGESPVIYGDGEQSRDFCYIDNVVEANLQAAEAPGLQGEVMNIACGERTTLNEILKEIAGQLGVKAEARYEPPRRGDVRHSLAAIDEARRLIGYEPRILFAEGLRRTVDWFRQQKHGSAAR